MFPRARYNVSILLDSDQELPTQKMAFVIALNTAVGITCLLSILGSMAIILSFVLFKELRTTGRFILLNLSLADLIVAIANLIGAATSYKFHDMDDTKLSNGNKLLCQIDAFFSLFATDSSILWTIVLLTYLYVTIRCCRISLCWNRIIIIICMIVCWCLPLAISLWFIIKGYFGFQAGFSPGFCTFTASNKSEIYRPIVGYEMFLYPSFIILPILCIAFVCHSKCKKRSMEKNNYHYLEQHVNALRTAERKLLFVPIVFIFIRIWGLITDVITFYIMEPESMKLREQTISAFLVFMAGIGDSSQGFVNGVFFCLLTPAVRQRLILLCCKFGYICRCYCCSQRYESLVSSLSNVSSSSVTVAFTNSTSSRGGGGDNDGEGDTVSINTQSLGNISADYGSND